MTVYALKPRFQGVLRPLVAPLPRIGVTANSVTLLAALGSVLVGAATIAGVDARPTFLLIPAWLLVRMSLNAVDGMLAREWNQKSVLGGYLNEIGDIVSDAALYAPFALVAPFGAFDISMLIMLSILTEFAGVLGPMMGASRRYDGPMGKGDRAIVFGALGLWVGCSAPLAPWMEDAVPIMVILRVVTAMNRISAGIREGERSGATSC